LGFRLFKAFRFKLLDLGIRTEDIGLSVWGVRARVHQRVRLPGTFNGLQLRATPTLDLQ